MENTAEKQLFLVKGPEYVRFTVSGENVEITRFNGGLVQHTETAARTGARSVWKYLLGRGFAEMKSAPVDVQPAPRSEFAPVITGLETDADRAARARAEKMDADRRAELAKINRVSCPHCNGSGKFRGVSRMKCRRCRGTGSIATKIQTA